MGQKDKRFVIQEHKAGKEVHWDLMFESGNTLQTYRLDKSPEDILQSSANAVKIFDHSLEFLIYQGPVNKGQGNVCIVEAGTYQKLKEKHNFTELNLNGQILRGKFLFVRIENDKWILRKK